MHSRSLPAYLASARPHIGRGDDKTAELLQHIVEDQQLMVHQFADLIGEESGTVETGEFPMEFTDLHDLSIDFLMQQVASRQKREVAEIERLSSQLDAWPQAKAIAQESLGAAKAHLLSLEECLEPVS